MVKITLCVKNGKNLREVSAVLIPEMNPMPELVIWGGRIFKQEAQELNKDLPPLVYIESFAVVALTEEAYDNIGNKNNSKSIPPTVKPKSDDELLMGIPKDLNEAVETIREFYRSADLLEEVLTMTEEEFLSSTHHAGAMMLRNAWFLWWEKDHKNVGVWPTRIPPIVQWFNEHKIFHADDMSGIMMTCTYRNIMGVDYELDKQIAMYHEYWRDAGINDWS